MKRNSNPDIITEQELKDSLRSAGLTDEGVDEAIRSGINFGLFSSVVGAGGIPCYKAGKDTAFKLKDVGEFLLSAWGEKAQELDK